MAQKSDLISGIQLAYDETMAFASELSDRERSTPGLVDRWTARDVLAHLGDSNQQMVETLAAGRRGETPPSGRSNEEVYHQYKDQPWEVLLTVIRQAYASLFEQVQALNEDELNAPAEWLNGRVMWRAIAGTGFLHPVIHLAQAFIERGERERAIRLNDRATDLSERLDDSPDWQGLFLYNTGCFYALMGEKQLALDKLERGFRLSSRLVEFSKQDTDLVSLQVDADFLALLDRVSIQEQSSIN
jgi:tetratricopeptide (TPR) repeat protein